MPGPSIDLIANIAAEEYGHIELVTYTINLLLTGTSTRGTDPAAAPLAGTEDNRNTLHFIASGQTALPVDSMGRPWTGDNVFSSGNLKLDLLHNFFLECGARANKIRVYETTDDPTVRAMTGYLLVRGGVHVVAYARALEVLTGADLGKLFPIPDITNKAFPRPRCWRTRGCTGSCTATTRRTTPGWARSSRARTRKTGPPLVVEDGHAGRRRATGAGGRATVDGARHRRHRRRDAPANSQAGWKRNSRPSEGRDDRAGRGRMPCSCPPTITLSHDRKDSPWCNSVTHSRPKNSVRRRSPTMRAWPRMPALRSPRSPITSTRGSTARGTARSSGRRSARSPRPPASS